MKSGTEAAVHRAVLRTVATGALAAFAVSLAVALVGTLGVQLERSLHFDPSFLGLLVCLYYAGWVLASPAAGLLVHHLGEIRLMRVCALSTGLVMATIAVFGRPAWHLVVLLPVCGAAAGIAQPGINAYLASSLPPRRLGMALGVKQSVPPVATLLGGLAVPAVALTVGWRWVFFGGACLAVAMALLLWSRRFELRAEASAGAARDRVSPSASGPALAVLTIGSGLANASASALVAFTVVSAVSAGLPPAVAGLVVAAGSCLALGARLALGAAADRSDADQFPRIAALLAAGAVGSALLALAAGHQLVVLFTCGAIVALGGGWGWSGLFYTAVVTAHRGGEARATSIVQIGGGAGTALGPLAFGLLSADASYAVAWLGASVVGFAAAAVMLVGARMAGAVAP
jgi:MFS family permease